jgi:hypothetical protein
VILGQRRRGSRGLGSKALTPYLCCRLDRPGGDLAGHLGVVALVRAPARLCDMDYGHRSPFPQRGRPVAVPPAVLARRSHSRAGTPLSVAVGHEASRGARQRCASPGLQPVDCALPTTDSQLYDLFRLKDKRTPSLAPLDPVVGTIVTNSQPLAPC